MNPNQSIIRLRYERPTLEILRLSTEEGCCQTASTNPLHLFPGFLLGDDGPF